MQNRNHIKKMKVLLYTGLMLVITPAILLGFIIFFSTRPNSEKNEKPTHDSSLNKKIEVERKVIYDTVRIEVPIHKPKKKKVTSDSIQILRGDSLRINISQDPA
jgi:hypothetical protein